MILVTVGMQLGFDRLIRAMDMITPELGMQVVAQTGKGDFQPRHMEAHNRLDPQAFETLASDARVLVSHAGIGTVLTAARVKRPIVLFPRRAALKEHRNDHQLATVSQLQGRAGIFVAMDEEQLPTQIEKALSMGEWSQEQSSSAQRLNDAVASFIDGAKS
ncbi:MAG: glycosyltransferase [Pseudomonadota bacterium]